ncbi:MAG: HEAT repeat domain-containing protein [Candidatus Gastranaerophilaceae bacterium]|jgi:HEAT repeat protein
MSELNESSLSQLAEEYKIATGIKTDEHISLLREIESYSEEETVSILTYFVSIETNPDVLLHIIKTLAKYNNKSSVDVFIEMLLWKEKFKNYIQNVDEYLKVRCTLAAVLGNIKDNKAVLPLLYVLNNKGENYKLRLACAEALGRIGDKYAVAPLIDVVSDEGEKSIYLRESAAKALGMLGDFSAIDPLVTVLETKKGIIYKFSFLKEKIVEAIGKLGGRDDRTIKALKSALLDEASYVRAGAIEALSEIDNDKVLPLIEKMLEDQDEEVLRAAVTAIYNLQGLDYISNLLERENISSQCKEEIEMIIQEEQEEENVE